MHYNKKGNNKKKIQYTPFEQTYGEQIAQKTRKATQQLSNQIMLHPKLTFGGGTLAFVLLYLYIYGSLPYSADNNLDLNDNKTLDNSTSQAQINNATSLTHQQSIIQNTTTPEWITNNITANTSTPLQATSNFTSSKPIEISDIEINCPPSTALSCIPSAYPLKKPSSAQQAFIGSNPCPAVKVEHKFNTGVSEKQLFKGSDGKLYVVKSPSDSQWVQHAPHVLIARDLYAKCGSSVVRMCPANIAGINETAHASEFIPDLKIPFSDTALSTTQEKVEASKVLAKDIAIDSWLKLSDYHVGNFGYSKKTGLIRHDIDFNLNRDVRGIDAKEFMVDLISNYKEVTSDKLHRITNGDILDGLNRISKINRHDIASTVEMQQGISNLQKRSIITSLINDRASLMNIIPYLREQKPEEIFNTEDFIKEFDLKREIQQQQIQGQQQFFRFM